MESLVLLSSRVSGFSFLFLSQFLYLLSPLQTDPNSISSCCFIYFIFNLIGFFILFWVCEFEVWVLWVFKNDLVAGVDCCGGTVVAVEETEQIEEEEEDKERKKKKRK
jgi:hypothetical protein